MQSISFVYAQDIGSELVASSLLIDNSPHPSRMAKGSAKNVCRVPTPP
jgi:hypothetical protein